MKKILKWAATSKVALGVFALCVPFSLVFIGACLAAKSAQQIIRDELEAKERRNVID